jgi:hypothetical protein
MYDVYDMYRKNESWKSPSVITISSRESYKTLTESILSVILMAHFGATICHMAAIVPQATAAKSYTNTFLTKMAPYLEHHGMFLNTQNSKEITIKNKDGSSSWMKIVVATITGANSSHSNLLCVDEVDTIRSAEGIRAFKEAEFIPGVFNGQHPLTIKTSTMKFPGGLFSKEMEKAVENNWNVYRWNIIDITEKCQPERHRPDLPHKTIYVNKNLPLETLDKEGYGRLQTKVQENYDEITVMGGCATCKLAPVCRGRLANRSEKDVGGLWKPIDFVISQFAKTDPDLAEAQLMCWKPSSQGMVYPRFLDKDDGSGNTYTLKQAWERYTGTTMHKDIEIEDLVQKMIEAGVKFQVGGDWGHAHAQAFVVTALLPSQEWWLVDAYSIPGLEFDEILDLALKIKAMYKPTRWHLDTAEPMFIKTFRKNGMVCSDFKKDVRGGIEAVRGQIINAKGIRKLKVVKHARTKILMSMFAEHSFKLDTLGDLTQEPDDSEVADIADALRYAAQNMFKAKGKLSAAPSQPPPADIYNKQYPDWLSQKVRELTDGQGFESKGKSSDGLIIWDFGSDDTD